MYWEGGRGRGREVSGETIPYASFIGIIGAETNPIAVSAILDNFSRVGGSERFSERFFGLGRESGGNRGTSAIVTFVEDSFVPETRRAR